MENTYAEIAEQKVGALKTGVPFIYATDRKEVWSVFQQKAKELTAPTYELGSEFWFTEKETTFSVSIGQLYCLEKLSLSMPGYHQKANASLAVMTVMLLQKDFPTCNTQTIRKGLQNGKWIGRTEWIRPRLMIDGAHNQESVSALATILRENYADKKIHILFAAIAGKPVNTMLETLDQFDSLTVTTFSYSNSLKFEAYPCQYARVASWQEWLHQIDNESSDAIWILIGSLYFISEVRQQLLG